MKDPNIHHLSPPIGEAYPISLEATTEGEPATITPTFSQVHTAFALATNEALTKARGDKRKRTSYLIDSLDKDEAY